MDIKEVLRECSAIHAQLNLSLTRESRHQEHEVPTGLKSRLQESQSASTTYSWNSKNSDRNSSGETLPEESEDWNPYLTWRPGLKEKTIPVPHRGGGAVEDDDLDMMSTTASYEEVRNEIAHMLDGYSIPPAAADVHEVQNEIVHMLGGYSIPPTEIEVGQALIPVTNLDLATTVGPPCPAEVSQRIDDVKMEIAAERSLQAKMFSDTAASEEAHARDVDILKLMIEQARQKHRELKAKIGALELQRSSNMYKQKYGFDPSRRENHPIESLR